MTLKFPDAIYIQPGLNGGGGGTSWQYVQLWNSNGLLGTWSELTDITAISENAWTADINGETITIGLETDAEIGDTLTKIYDSNGYDVYLYIDIEYIEDTFPQFE